MNEDTTNTTEDNATEAAEGTNGTKMPNVPTPDEAAQKRREMMQRVRAGQGRKRENREKVSGEKEKQPTANDGDSDTIKKLRAEKEVIVNALRELVASTLPVHKKDMKQKDWDRFTKARDEADELVRLIDAVPKT